MLPAELLQTIEFLRETERLKNVYRTSWTSGGHPETVASHTWRLCLMALVFEKSFPQVNFSRLIKICVIHDLGEAIGGDIPAIHQKPGETKSGKERQDLLTLLKPLPGPAKSEITSLWDEYEAATTPEAKIAKALDKLETIMQHNQGANPPDFDYEFNVDYGRKATEADPLTAAIREILDEETRTHAGIPDLQR